MHQKDGKPPFSVPALQTSCCREGVGEGGWCKATCHTAETPEAQAHLHRWENYSYGAWVV